jgi:hypothetical protein
MEIIRAQVVSISVPCIYLQCEYEHNLIIKHLRYPTVFMGYQEIN